MLIALGLIFGTTHFAHAESVKTHVVLPGDTLGKIAKKYKLTIAELVEFNPQLKDPNALEVGMPVQLEAAAAAEPEAPEAETKPEEAPEAAAKPEEAPAAEQEKSEDAQSTTDETPAEEATTTQSAEGDEPLPDLVDLPSAEEIETPATENLDGTQSGDAEAVPSLSLNESAENEVIADPRGLRAALGMIYMQRWGLLRAKSGIQDPPTYFGGIPGLLLQVELYPQLMFPFLEGDAAIWLEKLGFRLESHFASIGTPSELSKKNHMAGAWSATTFYRYQFWQDAMAPEIAGGLGYTHFRHPMEDEAYFPGSRYNALGINGTLDLPLAIGFKIPFIRKLMATGTVTYYPWVGASGKLKRLGKKDGSIAARIEGGGHITLDLEELDPIFRNMPIILRMLLRAEYFGTNYKGETSLPTSSQFTDTSLHDMMVGIHITAGILY